MRRLLKWMAVLGLILYLALGEGTWPSTARAVWQTMDQATGRCVLSWGVQLRDKAVTDVVGDRVIVWIWYTRDTQEREVMRRYLALRGYTLR